MNVTEACRMLRNGVGADLRDAIERALNLSGMRWRNDLNALQVDTLADKMKRIYTGTQWSNGKIAPVLAEGCERKKGEHQPRRRMVAICESGRDVSPLVCDDSCPLVLGEE